MVEYLLIAAAVLIAIGVPTLRAGSRRSPQQTTRNDNSYTPDSGGSVWSFGDSSTSSADSGSCSSDSSSDSSSGGDCGGGDSGGGGD